MVLISSAHASRLTPAKKKISSTGGDRIPDLWIMIDSPKGPFIYTIDKDSTGSNAESEYIFARFAQNSFDMEAVAVNSFNVSMRIEEEF